MKKLFISLLTVPFFLISCKKTWTCECEVSGTTFNPQTNQMEPYTEKIIGSIHDQRKSDAETICENYAETAGFTMPTAQPSNTNINCALQ